MSNDAESKSPSLPQLLAGVPKTPVEVLEPAVVVGDVKLADGTTMKVRVLINGAFKLDGMTDEAGRPVYQIDAMVIPSVKDWKR